MPGPGNVKVGIYERDQSGAYNFLGASDTELPVVYPGHLYYIAYAAASTENALATLIVTINDGSGVFSDQNLVQNATFTGGANPFGWAITGFASIPDSNSGLHMPASSAGISQTIPVERGRLYAVGVGYVAEEGYSKIAVRWQGALLGNLEVDSLYSPGLIWTNFFVRASSSEATISIENFAGRTTLSQIKVRPLNNAFGDGPQELQTISFAPVPDLPAESAPVALQASSDSGLPVQFSLEAGPAMLQGGTLTVTGSGLISIIARQPGNSVYYPAPEIRRTFTALKRMQTVTFAPAIPEGDVAPLIASSSSGLPVTFQVLSGPGIVHGNSVTNMGVGPVVVEATQVGNDTYAPSSAMQSVVFRRLPQIVDVLSVDHAATPVGSVRLTALAQPSRTFPLLGVASSGLPVTLAVVSGSAAVSGNSITIAGRGAAVLRATQAGDSLFSPASVDRVFPAIPKQAQAIQFEPLPDLPMGTEAINLHAQASSGLPITFSVLSGNATLVGSVLTLAAAGPVAVKASQEGNEEFDAAPEVVRTFEITRLTQTIWWSSVPELHFGDGPIALLAAASSGLPVSFELLSGPGNLEGNTLSVSSVGIIDVRATQGGDSKYLPNSVDLQLEVGRAIQTIDFQPPSRLSAGTSITLGATASSGLAIKFAVVSGPGAISGNNQLTVAAAGTLVLEARQEGDGLHERLSKQLLKSPVPLLLLRS